MENCLKLVVAKLEIILGSVEVLFKHGHIIVLEGVVQRQIAIVVYDIRSWADLINDGELFLHADDVLNSLSLVVLHATGLKELIVPAEPVENVLVSISCTLKQRVLSKVIPFLERFILEFGE